MKYFVCFASMFLVLACTSVVMAVDAGVSGDFTKPSPSLPDWFSATQGSVTITTGSGGGGIYLDPNAGPWQKQIVGIMVSPLPVTEGPILIAGDPTYNPPPGPPWTDWDEQVLTPNWKWGNGSQIVITESDGITQHTYNGILKTMQWANDFVEFDFPAEFPGASITVTKTLVYTGPNPQPGPGNAMNVWIAEFPTPEPGTIALLTTGLLALGLGCIWRRRN